MGSSPRPQGGAGALVRTVPASSEANLTQINIAASQNRDVLTVIFDRDETSSNGILWVGRSGAPWRRLPGNFGPHTTCYNRFVRWRRAGVWDQLMNVLTAGHDTAVQMIDTPIVRVHQQGTCIAGNGEQLMDRSRGGLTTKIL
jgi:transposase